MKQNLLKCLLFLSLFLTGKVTVAQWTQLNPTNPVGISRPTTFVIGDTIYMGNGDVGNFNYSQAWHGYTSGSNTWWPERQYPGAGGDMGYNFVINNQAYVGGGATYSYYSDLYMYDPTAGWTSKGTGTGGIPRAFSLGFAINGKGYVCTGCNNYGTPLGDVWEYDPTNGANGTWTQKNPFPGGARYGGAAFILNGKAYVGLGGNNVPNKTFNDMYEYDPTNDTWRQMASMPSTYGIMEPGYVVLCNKLLVTSGDTAHNGNIEGQTWMFDPADGPIGSWYQLPDFQGVAAYSPQGAVLNDTSYMMGGKDASGNYLGQMYRYLPSLISVSPTASICSGSSVTLSADGSGAFKWAPSSSLTDSVTTSSLATGGQVSTVASPLVTTTYTVTEAVCDVQTATIVVNVGSGQADTVKATPSSVCSGNSSQLTVTGSGSFTWSPSTGLGTDTTGNTVTASPLTTTTYTVTTGSGGCAFTGTVVVAVANTAVGGHVTTARDTICQGTPGNLILNGSSGTGIQWQSSPDDITYTDISAATNSTYKTTPLQQSTWYHAVVGTGNCSATSDSLQLYVPPALTASFKFTQGASNQLMFNSDSSIGNIRSYHWDFGDGGTSSDSNPSHTFAKDTTYYVCLTLYDGSNCSYTFCRYSQVSNGVGVPAISAAGNWIIYPNPFSERLTVNPARAGLTVSSHIQSIEMYDVLGRIVINQNLGNITNTSLQLDVSSLAKGMYYVMIRTANADYVQKVVKQ